MGRVSQGIRIASVKSAGKNTSLVLNTRREIEMSNRNAKGKKLDCLRHRQAQYDKALDGLIRGVVTPEYVMERWQKLKEVKGR